jgi:hypothetical protein
LTGKVAIFEGFSGMFHEKFETCSVDVCKRLSQDQSYTSHAVFQHEFVSKIYRVSRCVCQIAVFVAKKGEERLISRKIFLQISSLIFRELPHTLLIGPIGPREEVFPEIGSTEISVTCCTILFYPRKRTKLYIFR